MYRRGRRLSKRVGLGLVACLVLAAGLFAAMTARGAGPGHKIEFEMVRSAGAVGAGCLPDAQGRVEVASKGPVQVMKVKLSGMPADTDFALFVIQVPNGPFGISWYQGDIETNADGRGEGKFVGIFSDETFAFALGTTAAPTPHAQDASSNPQTPPVHTYHLGLWFDSPAGATAAGCPGATTPFNGDHTAGVQAMSTRNFPSLEGPLQQLSG